MTRVGYDEATQKYTYQDQDGSYWEGPEGARFGQLTKGMDRTKMVHSNGATSAYAL
jgi:hypothetical protein